MSCASRYQNLMRYAHLQELTIQIMSQGRNLEKEHIEQIEKNIQAKLDMQRLPFLLSCIDGSDDQNRAEIATEFMKTAISGMNYRELLTQIETDEKQEATEQDILDQLQLGSTIFKNIYRTLNKRVFQKITLDMETSARLLHAQRDFRGAISMYSLAIQRLDEFSRNGQISPTAEAAVFVHRKLADLLLQRVTCLYKLNQYEKTLMDLNQVISISVQSRDPIEDLKVNTHLLVVKSMQSAVFLRARVWLKVGNSAMALNDYKYLYAGFDHVLDELMGTPRKAWNRMVKLNEKGLIRHPCSLSFPRRNKHTKKLNRFSRSGWKQLKPLQGTSELPAKHGHIMVEHNSYFYVLGGTSAPFGGEICATKSEQRKEQAFFFFKIDVVAEKQQYTLKRLFFPDELFDCWLNDPVTLAMRSKKRMLTGSKWRNKWIVFGGYHFPFQTVVVYEFDTEKWTTWNLKTPKALKKCEALTHAAAVVMNDVLYVFGGELRGKVQQQHVSGETNLFCALHLKTKRWEVLTQHNALNVDQEKRMIPGSRFDHVIWKDSQCGKAGSVFIAYGNHARKPGTMELQRADVWRFDVAASRWNLESSYNSKAGNYPEKRGECAYVAYDYPIEGGVILFGGYCASSMSVNLAENVMKTYSFFGDCFQYLPKLKKWVMIQSKVFPAHRAYASICLGTCTRTCSAENRNVLICYGGYHGGICEENRVFDDIWMLDMDSLFPKLSKRAYKACVFPLCRRTEYDMQLYKCKGACQQTYYCSKLCQKRDWHRHRLHCRRK